MTLDEKVAQLIQLVPGFFEGSKEKGDVKVVPITKFRD